MDILNIEQPKLAPAKKGGETQHAVAHLVTVDGEEHYIRCLAVRFTPTHIMVRLSDEPGFPSPEDYCWLRRSDVELTGEIY